jgi:hypothetical protein
MTGTTTITGTVTTQTLKTPYTTVTSTGKIKSSNVAVIGQSTNSLTLNNAGSIAGYSIGVYISSASAAVINTGVINGYAPDQSGEGVVLYTGGSVTNASAGALITGTQYGVAVRGNSGTVLNAGSISANSSDAVGMAQGGYVSNASTGRITGGHSATGSMGVAIEGGTGKVVNNGLIESYTTYGVDLIGGGTIINAGSIAGATVAAKFAGGFDNLLVLDPGGSFSGRVLGGNTAGSAFVSTLELASGASAGTLSNLYLQFAQIDIDAGAVWNVFGTHILDAGYTLTNAGTLFDGGSLTITNAGVLNGDGKVVIESGSTLIDAGTVASSQTLAFGGANAGISLLPGSLPGVFGNFNTGDTISLTGVTNVASYSVINGNTLDIVRSDNSHIDLTFDRDYTTPEFTVTTTGGNAVVTTQTVTCFAGGTRLDTEDGSVAVEDLNIGDEVLTASGQVRAVRWIGRRHLDLTRHPDPKLVQPIRIMAEALDAGMPRRDLLVSPDHAMLLDGLLIPARLLLNGVTIRREERWSSLTYYHIELDSHDVLLAEGAPAESYLDTGNRNTFENADGPMVLHPDMNEGQARREAESCAPFAADAERVEPVWKRLLQRATLLGLTMPEPVETTADPALRVEVAGRSFAPIAVEGRRYVFVLPKWQGALRLRSRLATPCEGKPWVDDQRKLGVKVLRMTLAGMSGNRTVPVDHPALASGWWDTEQDAGIMGRWTNGDATIAIASATPCRFEVELGGTMDYVQTDELRDVLALCA